jgi:hypothetical protein
MAYLLRPLIRRRAIAAEPVIVERSRHQAEQALGSFFKAVGWTVSVRWQD